MKIIRTIAKAKLNMATMSNVTLIPCISYRIEPISGDKNAAMAYTRV